ncbi:uncharacterized [Tachysurus ichikawai]
MRGCGLTVGHGLWNMHMCCTHWSIYESTKFKTQGALNEGQLYKDETHLLNIKAIFQSSSWDREIFYITLSH